MSFGTPSRAATTALRGMGFEPIVTAAASAGWRGHLSLVAKRTATS